MSGRIWWGVLGIICGSVIARVSTAISRFMPQTTNDDRACHSYALRVKYLTVDNLVSLINHYPMTLSCGSTHSCIVISNTTPGYTIGNRAYCLIAGRPDQSRFPRYLNTEQLHNLLQTTTHAELAGGHQPKFDHIYMFERTISGIQWTRLINHLVERGLVTVRECLTDQCLDTRVITHINNVHVIDMPVDTLSSTGVGIYEETLFTLYINGSCVIDPAIMVNISTRVDASDGGGISNVMAITNTSDVSDV